VAIYYCNGLGPHHFLCSNTRNDLVLLTCDRLTIRLVYSYIYIYISYYILLTRRCNDVFPLFTSTCNIHYLSRSRKSCEDIPSFKFTANLDHCEYYIKFSYFHRSHNIQLSLLFKCIRYFAPNVGARIYRGQFISLIWRYNVTTWLLYVQLFIPCAYPALYVIWTKFTISPSYRYT
jgi:hypothetical protein